MDAETKKRFEEINAKRAKLEKTPTVWPKKEDALKIFKSHGFKCAICKNPGLGNINGYVLLPKSHPDAGKSYEEIDVSVHGGLTFGQKDSRGGTWYGFDTAHAGDALPLMPYSFGGNRQWAVEDVQAEAEQLAEQFANRAKILARK